MIKKLLIFNLYSWLIFSAVSPVCAADEAAYPDIENTQHTSGVGSYVQSARTNVVWIVSSVWWAGWGLFKGAFNKLGKILRLTKAPKSPRSPLVEVVAGDGGGATKKVSKSPRSPIIKVVAGDEAAAQEDPAHKEGGRTDRAFGCVLQPGSGEVDDWQRVDNPTVGGEGNNGKKSPTSRMYFPGDGPTEEVAT